MNRNLSCGTQWRRIQWCNLDMMTMVSLCKYIEQWCFALTCTKVNQQIKYYRKLSLVLFHRCRFGSDLDRSGRGSETVHRQRHWRCWSSVQSPQCTLALLSSQGMTCSFDTYTYDYPVLTLSQGRSLDSVCEEFAAVLHMKDLLYPVGIWVSGAAQWRCPKPIPVLFLETISGGQSMHFYYWLCFEGLIYRDDKIYDPSFSHQWNSCHI